MSWWTRAERSTRTVNTHRYARSWTNCVICLMREMRRWKFSVASTITMADGNVKTNGVEVVLTRDQMERRLDVLLDESPVLTWCAVTLALVIGTARDRWADVVLRVRGAR